MIPDDIYEPILKKANRIGQSPEQIVLECLQHAIKKLTDEDPLLQLAGAFESDTRDISERHDDYIGHNLSPVGTYENSPAPAKNRYCREAGIPPFFKSRRDD